MRDYHLMEQEQAVIDYQTLKLSSFLCVRRNIANIFVKLLIIFLPPNLYCLFQTFKAWNLIQNWSFSLYLLTSVIFQTPTSERFATLVQCYKETDNLSVWVVEMSRRWRVCIKFVYKNQILPWKSLSSRRFCNEIKRGEAWNAADLLCQNLKVISGNKQLQLFQALRVFYLLLRFCRFE